MLKELYWRERATRYFHTYKALGLGLIWTPVGETIRDGFLYQEPNPDYDMWYPKNCTPIFFKDWIWDKIPEGMTKPKPGPKSKAFYIIPRPIICIETGKYYPSVRAAKEDGFEHAGHVAKGDSHHIFDHECRFTYVDPFLPWDDEPWVGKINVNFNPKSSGNHKTHVTVDGKYFDTMNDAATYLAEQTGYARSTIYEWCLKKRLLEYRGHSIKYSK